MNTLVDGWLVFSRALMSCLAAVHGVAPVSRIPVWRFVILRAHFAAILFCGQGDAHVAIAAIFSIQQADRAFGTDYCLRFSFVILLS
jgi:hypothetical protein